MSDAPPHAKFRWSEATDRVLRQCFGAVPLRDVAAAFGTRADVVQRRANRLGLRSRPKVNASPSRLAALHQRVAARAVANAEFATAYGLPASLRPMAVRVLIALATGPATREELALRVGILPPRELSKLHLRELMSHGLVFSVPRSTKVEWHGRGRGGQRRVSVPSLYTLTAATLDMLAGGREGER